MDRCESCGNEYHRSFRVEMSGAQHVFDCFECAINVLAPACASCGTRIVGHGVEATSGTLYCCAYCARKEGVAGVRDHA